MTILKVISYKNFVLNYLVFPVMSCYARVHNQNFENKFFRLSNIMRNNSLLKILVFPITLPVIFNYTYVVTLHCFKTIKLPLHKIS